MSDIVAAIALTPRRIRIIADGTLTSFSFVTFWYISRADGAGTDVSVVGFWQPDAGAFAYELALSEDLVAHVGYLVTASSADNDFITVWQPPLLQPAGLVPLDDPEAEALGVDWDWLAASLDGAGDLPLVRGRPCLLHDLAAIAETVPGELFHRPREGAGLPTRVNGPAALGSLAASVRAAWRADDRVRRATVEVTAGTNGEVTISGKIEPVALNETIPVTTRSG
jgi:hypothetical protein